jgi:3-hydroxyisobutyrate dehydrogenase-like beta-hydroxyacid dehydrogenase
MDKRVGVIGLGLMGTALTERLLSAGYQAVVFNRTREKARPLVESGAEWSENPLESCDRVLISLYTTDIVAEVLAQLESAYRPGLVLIDTTTGDPAQVTALGRRLEERGVLYIEAPVSGSSEQVRQGEVMTLVAGPPDSLSACQHILATFSQEWLYVGPWGSASNMKLVSNLILGLNRAALAEGLSLASAMHLSPELTLAVLIKSAAYSKVMDVKGRKMIDNDFAAQARLSQHLKDVRLILAEGERRGARLPLSHVHRQLLDCLEWAGMGDLDNSAIIRAFRPPFHSSPTTASAETKTCPIR